MDDDRVDIEIVRIADEVGPPGVGGYRVSDTGVIQIVAGVSTPASDIAMLEAIARVRLDPRFYGDPDDGETVTT